MPRARIACFFASDVLPLPLYFSGLLPSVPHKNLSSDTSTARHHPQATFPPFSCLATSSSGPEASSYDSDDLLTNFVPRPPAIEWPFCCLCVGVLSFSSEYLNKGILSLSHTHTHTRGEASTWVEACQAVFTELLRRLYWLPVRLRTEYKLASFWFQCLSSSLVPDCPSAVEPESWDLTTPFCSKDLTLSTCDKWYCPVLNWLPVHFRIAQTIETF